MTFPCPQTARGRAATLLSRLAGLCLAMRSILARGSLARPAHRSSHRTSRWAVRLGGVILLLACLAPLAAFAVSNPADMLPDPAQEERARALGQDLRCMVCQNQSIEDSEAGLARDLRLIVRERITAGDSNSQIMEYLHDRYGDFVLLRPPFAWNTAILWATPFLAILIGFGLILMARRNTAQMPPPAPLDESERQRLAALETKDGTNA